MLPVQDIDMRSKPLGYSLRRYYVDEFQCRRASTLPAGSNILDLGGTKLQKRGHFDIERYDFEVTYLNLTVSKSPDVQADAANIPFKDKAFDVVICSEVLEHVPDPRIVLQEAHRVLRQGGIMLITVPFLFHIHGDPYDYGRYTDYFWKENLAKIGFGEIVIERQGAFWSVFVDMLRDWAYDTTIRRKRHNSRIMRKIIRTGIGWMRRKALYWDQRHMTDASSFLSSYTTGFGIKAVKL